MIKESKVQVIPKLTTEERFRQILARPRNPNAQVRLAMPKYQPKIKQGNKY
jgi:hypothetical protein